MRVRPTEIGEKLYIACRECVGALHLHHNSVTRHIFARAVAECPAGASTNLERLLRSWVGYDKRDVVLPDDFNYLRVGGFQGVIGGGGGSRGTPIRTGDGADLHEEGFDTGAGIGVDPIEPSEGSNWGVSAGESYIG